MAIIELTLKAEYLGNWELWHGIRELLQNARDAEIQNDAPMEVDFRTRRVDGHETGGLIISNTGTTLPLEALLIGHSTKEGDSRLIGKYGEGLKFSMLALLRKGLKVKIRNGSDVWIPQIVQSSTFDAKVLAFEILKGRKFEDRVQFEIIGLNDKTWEVIKSRILFLSDEAPKKKITTYSGEILLDAQHKGKIFVKGIYVADIDHQFGFNLFEADIDRDRRMIDNPVYTLDKVMNEAMNTDLGRQYVGHWFYENLKEGKIQYSYWLDGIAKDYIAAKFASDFGENAVAVENDQELSELEHFGTKGAKANRNIRAIVEEKTGTAAQNISKLRTSAKVTFSRRDLNLTEIANYEHAYKLVNEAYKRSGEVSDLDVDVVEFSSESLNGTYNRCDGKIRVARKLLSRPADLIVTLVHEAAHKYGSSGETMHQAEERLMTYVIGMLLK